MYAHSANPKAVATTGTKSGREANIGNEGKPAACTAAPIAAWSKVLAANAAVIFCINLGKVICSEGDAPVAVPTWGISVGNVAIGGAGGATGGAKGGGGTCAAGCANT